MLSHELDKMVFEQIVQPPIADVPDGSTLPATYIDVSEYDYFAFDLILGATDRTNTKIQVVQATDSAGTGSKNVSGAVNTAFGATSDNKMARVECRASALDTANGFRYVAVTITNTGGAAALGAIMFKGWRARNLPVTQPAAFAEIVRV
jgi:hypothetical protein